MVVVSAPSIADSVTSEQGERDLGVEGERADGIQMLSILL